MSAAERRMGGGSERRKSLRRWAWRHPHIVLWRLLVWLRYVRSWPTLSGLVFINPRPLDPVLTAGLMAQPILEDELDGYGTDRTARMVVPPPTAIKERTLPSLSAGTDETENT